MNSTLSWEACALGEGARDRADAQPRIPHSLTDIPDRIFDGLANFIIACEKEEINVGVGEQLLAPIASYGGHRDPLPHCVKNRYPTDVTVLSTVAERAAAQRNPSPDASKLRLCRLEFLPIPGPQRCISHFHRLDWRSVACWLGCTAHRAPSRRVRRCGCGSRRRSATEKSCRRRFCPVRAAVTIA